MENGLVIGNDVKTSCSHCKQSGLLHVLATFEFRESSKSDEAAKLAYAVTVRNCSNTKCEAVVVAVESLQETVSCNPADTHRVGIQLRLGLLLVLFKTATIVRCLLEGMHKDKYPFLKAPTLKRAFPMDWLDAKCDEEIYNYSDPRKAASSLMSSIQRNMVSIFEMRRQRYSAE